MPKAIVRHTDRRTDRRFFVRSVDLGQNLDTFLVCAIVAVLGNRAFLIITGYPQLGNSTLHISHAIWGGLMMMLALVAAVAFLPPYTRKFVAVLGGAGFGWFIDELGKFITRDVNYFFQPTIALIYMTFIAMYLGFRALGRRRFGPDDGLLNALEALKAAAIGALDEPARREALALFDATTPQGPLAGTVRQLLGNARALPPRHPGWFARTGQRLRSFYLRQTSRLGFPAAVNTLFTVYAVGAFANVVGFALDGRGIVTFAEWATVGSSVASGGLIVIGIWFLRTSRLGAYQWFERGLLVEIFMTQVFVFAEEELAGIVGLVITLVIWQVLRSAIRAEREAAVTTS